MLVTEKKYYSDYHKLISHEIETRLQNHDFSEQKLEFGYSTQACAVYSANIEGNSLDLNS